MERRANLGKGAYKIFEELAEPMQASPKVHRAYDLPDSVELTTSGELELLILEKFPSEEAFKEELAWGF